MSRKSLPFVADTPGKRIATARRLLGVREGQDILVPDIAKRMGMTNNAVYAWEADESAPRGATLDKLAATLGVSTVWIQHGRELAGADEPDVARRTYADELTPQAQSAEQIQAGLRQRDEAAKKKGKAS